jgi:hypothetical protein
MHENLRYVKLAWIGLLAALALASPAQAEIVAPTVDRGLLAVAPDGTPRVAFVSGRQLVLARRGTDRWTFAGVGHLPAGKPVLAGLVVDRRARASVMVEAENGAWLALASAGKKLHVVVRPRKGATLGPAGLTLDAAGRPAFAYALRLSSAKSWLRLVTVDARGKLHTHGITKGGFPSSVIAPGAAPVLVGRTLHVVETYTSAAIDWGPKRRGGWEGQFIFGSIRGTPQGRVGATFLAPTLWSAWTQVTPELGSIDVVLTASAATQESYFLTHGIFVSLLLASGQPEVGAYDWVELGDAFSYVGVLADVGGAFSELDGRLEGYLATPNGGRQLLLSTASGLEWFQTPARPAIRVVLTDDLSGHVAGATGGVVDLYRESPAGRTLFGRAELAPDGSFAFSDPERTASTVYRAVYVDFATNVPYAALLRPPTG